MERYITLGADKNGEVYGLRVNDDGTSCTVIRPVTKENYEYLTEDPQSVKEQWQQAVQDGQTEKWLDDWFEDIDPEELMDKSSVYELLEDPDNPSVKAWQGIRMSFRDHVEFQLVESDKVPGIELAYDVYEWEASGSYPPTEPFAVEFAPKAVLEEYYAHLRETYKEFKG